MYKHILLPTDGSAVSDNAVKHGIELARTLGSKVTALTATEPFMPLAFSPVELATSVEAYTYHVQEHAKNILAAVAALAAEAGVPCETLQVEQVYPYQAIIETAGSKGCDLILMASHGRRGVSAILLGSETQKVLTYSKIPVLVYR